MIARTEIMIFGPKDDGTYVVEGQKRLQARRWRSQIPRTRDGRHPPLPRAHALRAVRAGGGGVEIHECANAELAALSITQSSGESRDSRKRYTKAVRRLPKSRFSRRAAGGRPRQLHGRAARS